MNSCTYFISGGLGFLGQYVVSAIRDSDPLAELRVLDCRLRPTLLGIVSMAGVQVIIGDLQAPDTFGEHLAGVDAVIHCAALISPKCDQVDLSYRPFAGRAR